MSIVFQSPPAIEAVVMHSVTSVCLCVGLPVCGQTFESTDLGTSFFLCGCIFRIPRSSLCIKIIEITAASNMIYERNDVRFTGGSPSIKTHTC